MAKKKEKLHVEKDDDDLKAYEFTVITVGHGRTPEEAWTGAVEHIMDNMKDFGDTKNLPDFKVIEE